MSPSPKQTTQTNLDLKDFFSATDARQDRWQQLNSTARALSQPQPVSGAHEQAVKLVGEMEPLESHYAYPGPNLLGELCELLACGVG